MATTTARSVRSSIGQRGGYTLVAAQGSEGYVAPHQPGAPADKRYMVVRCVHGGAWGIVDRRTGRLIDGAHPDEHRYGVWVDAQTAARALNEQTST